MKIAIVLQLVLSGLCYGAMLSAADNGDSGFAIMYFIFANVFLIGGIVALSQNN